MVCDNDHIMIPMHKHVYAVDNQLCLVIAKRCGSSLEPKLCSHNHHSRGNKSERACHVQVKGELLHQYTRRSNTFVSSCMIYLVRLKNAARGRPAKLLICQFKIWVSSEKRAHSIWYLHRHSQDSHTVTIANDTISSASSRSKSVPFD